MKRHALITTFLLWSAAAEFIKISVTPSVRHRFIRAAFGGLHNCVCAKVMMYG
ncbi:exported protein of unknown function [Citrobacter amalonaticus]|nr:exported protein of unknown function [Citrobacter amalonaticus]